MRHGIDWRRAPFYRTYKHRNGWGLIALGLIFILLGIMLPKMVVVLS